MRFKRNTIKNDMKQVIKKIAQSIIGQLKAKTLRRVFLFFLRARPEVWIPLARKSLYTIHTPDFVKELTIDRFSREDLTALYSQLKDQFQDRQLFFVTDSNITLNKDGLKEMDSSVDLSAISIKKRPVFICAFNSDEKMVRFLQKVKQINGAVYFTPTNGYPTARYFHRDDIARSVLIDESNKKDSTKFELADYENILQAIAITKNLPGPYVEIGVFKGDSARLSLNYFKRCGIEKASYFIDTYEGFSYDEAKQSADARWSGTHLDASMEQAEFFLADFPQKALVKMNVISDDLPEYIWDVSVCNIDVDMYEAVLAAAVKIAPRMAKGGIIILEDQGHTPALAGAYLATVEFLQSEAGHMFVPIHLYSGQMFLIKVFD